MLRVLGGLFQARLEGDKMPNVEAKIQPRKPDGKQWLPIHGIYRAMEDRKAKKPTVVDIYFNDKLATNFFGGMVDLFKAYSWVGYQSASIFTLGAAAYHSLEKLSQTITG